MQSGVLSLDSSSVASWPLHKGDGARAYMEMVNFNPPFPEPPIVLAFIAGLRTSNQADLRLNVEPVNITANNFYLKIGSYGFFFLFCFFLKLIMK